MLTHQADAISQQAKVFARGYPAKFESKQYLNVNCFIKENYLPDKKAVMPTMAAVSPLKL